MKYVIPVWNRYWFSNYLYAKLGNFAATITQTGKHHLIISTNRVLLLHETLTGRQHIARSIKEHQDSQLKRKSHSGCLHYASKVSLLPDTKPIHLHEFEANVS